MRNFADRIISYYILTHIIILYYYNKPPSAMRGLIWKSVGHELMVVLIHDAKSWAPCENVANLANEIAVARGVPGGVRSGVVEECPESKSGLPCRSTGRTKDKCVLESDVRTSSNCKTVLFDPSDTRAYGGIQREKRASTRAPRTYICRQGGEISQDDNEEGQKKMVTAEKGERARGGERGERPVSWVLYKLSCEGKDSAVGPPREALLSDSAFCHLNAPRTPLPRLVSPLLFLLYFRVSS